MAPVHGRPFLEILLDHWLDQGVRHFVLAVGYKFGAIRDHFGNSYRNARIDYSIESEPMGTGGGLLMALDRVERERFFIINGDTFYPITAQSMEQSHVRHDSHFTIALRRIEKPDRYGTVHLDPQGRIDAFYPPKSERATELINGGIYLAEKDFLKGFQEVWNRISKLSLEDDLFGAFLGDKNHIFGFVGEAPFIDIGVPSDYARFQETF
jgi:D-glycero-alpha-D-manno-heptose 1-phosphate guanylyltransferase